MFRRSVEYPAASLAFYSVIVEHFADDIFIHRVNLYANFIEKVLDLVSQIAYQHEFKLHICRDILGLRLGFLIEKRLTHGGE